MHVHLDPIGGIAGDMFLAAAVDVRPDLVTGAVSAMTDAGLPAACDPRFVTTNCGALRGRRFTLEGEGDPPPQASGRYSDIRAALAGSTLSDQVRQRALAIYRLLAEAEAAVHAVDVENVHFHELASWDTLADVVGAAFIIEALKDAQWSVSTLPLGGGRTTTMHGVLPLPAPATVVLLEGFSVHDDGIAGERVTPTGAAILRHLNPDLAMPGRPTVLRGQGYGFGSRHLPDIPNCLRAMVFEDMEAPVAPGARHEHMAVIAFEVDDQTPEDLALGLDAVRSVRGVVDVVQSPVFGKKNRMAVHVQVLCRPEHLERAIAACFRETTTIGLRWQWVGRIALERRTFGGEAMTGRPAVKVATRPDRRQTAKAEADDLTAEDGHVARRSTASTAECEALATVGPEESEP